MPVLKKLEACVKIVLADRRVGRTQCIEVIKIVQEEIQAIIVSEDPLKQICNTRKMKGAECSPKGRTISMK